MSDSPAPDAQPTAPDTPAPPPEDRYTEALRRFSGDLRMTRQVWQSMVDREVELHEGHYRLLLTAHLDGRDLDGARRVMEQMSAAGFAPDASVRWQVALATGRAGRAAEAAALLDQLREDGIEPPDHMLPSVFSVELAAGRLPAARAMLRRMAARGQSAQPAEYKALLADILDRRAIKDGKALFEAMLAAGHHPSTREVEQVVGMMARAGHTDRAEQLLALLAEKDVRIPADARNEIVLGWAKAGDVDKTRTALAEVEDAGGTSTSHHHNALLTAVIAAGDVDAAWQQAAHLADRAIPSGENLEGLVELSVKSKKTPLALSAIDWMLMLGVPAPPNRVADVVGALIADGQLDVAVEIFFETARRGVTPDRRKARDLVEALVKAGRLDDAKRLLDKLRRDKVLTNGRHWGSLLAALAKAGRSDDAVGLLREMLEAKLQPTVADASRIVGGMVKAHQYDAARELIETLGEAGIGVDEPTYRELMWSYARKGQYDPAKAVHDRMVAAGITPDDRHDKALAWASGETQRRLEPEDGDGDDAPAATGEAPQPAPAPAEAQPPADADTPAPTALGQAPQPPADGTPAEAPVVPGQPAGDEPTGDAPEDEDTPAPDAEEPPPAS